MFPIDVASTGVSVWASHSMTSLRTWLRLICKTSCGLMYQTLAKAPCWETPLNEGLGVRRTEVR